MPHPSEIPILSLEKLQALGMDEAEFGCCARTVKDGRLVVRAGCSNHPICQWASEPVPDRTAKDPKTGIENVVEGGQRPRNIKYLLVKPTVNGRRRIQEGYCACFEWHQNFSKLHRKNGVICRVVGTEGSSYQVRGSVKIPASEPGTEPRWEPRFWKETVPAFKPLIDVQGEQYADSVIRESELLQEDEELRAALVPHGDGAHDVTLELDDHEVAAAIEKRGRSKH